MSLEAFHAEYSRRTEDNTSYTAVRRNEYIPSLADMYKLPPPEYVGRSLLLFGNFDNNDSVSCVPWIGCQDLRLSENINTGGHDILINELVRGVHGFNIADYAYTSGKYESDVIGPHLWTGFTWKADTPGRLVVAVRRFCVEHDNDAETKISALKGVTSKGGVMKNHDVYVPGMKIVEGKVTSN